MISWCEYASDLAWGRFGVDPAGLRLLLTVKFVESSSGCCSNDPPQKKVDTKISE